MFYARGRRVTVTPVGPSHGPSLSRMTVDVTRKLSFALRRRMVYVCWSPSRFIVTNTLAHRPFYLVTTLSPVRAGPGRARAGDIAHTGNVSTTGARPLCSSINTARAASLHQPSSAPDLKRSQRTIGCGRTGRSPGPVARAGQRPQKAKFISILAINQVTDLLKSNPGYPIQSPTVAT